MNTPRPAHFLPFAFLVWIASAAFGESALWNDHTSSDVAWNRWSPELHDTAKAEDKPLFFFVAHYGNGLARAMRTETFANKTIAQTVNETSIPVLVDVNEQPELASFLRRLASEHFSPNDFPTCLWTDASFAPLNGGGYFPPTDDWGGQGFLSLARNVAEQWEQRREDFVSPAKVRLERSLETVQLEPTAIEAYAALLHDTPFVSREAPTLPALEFYNYANALQRLEPDQRKTLVDAMDDELDRIVSGAGFDSIDGGFFIGSNDPNWRLPLFQKSSADQALMLHAIAALNEVAPKSEYTQIIRLTRQFIESKLTKSNGLALRILDSFAEGETMDSVEGSYYLVSKSDLDSLSPETIAAWGLAPEGNLDSDVDILGVYQGQNVPFASEPNALSPAYDKRRLEIAKIRESKTPLLSEETGYTSINALLVRAYVKAGAALKDDTFLEAAKARYAAILENASASKLKTLYNSDSKQTPANSLDYANTIAAALDLHAATSKNRYLKDANTLLKAWISSERFREENLIAVASPSAVLLANYQDTYLPSAAATHLENLLRMKKLDKKANAGSLAEATLATVPARAKATPSEFLSLLLAAKQQP